MGEVHRAVDLRDNTRVALKLLPAATLPGAGATRDAAGGATDDLRVRARFRREAAVVAGLQHPNIVGVRDHGELEGHLFLAMDLIEGRDLARVLAEQSALAPARALRVIGQVAAALDAAHAAGVVHRDVKPSNILIAPNRNSRNSGDGAISGGGIGGGGGGGGGGETAYLADFGIALPGVAATRLTATGFAIGTAAYMAPELFGNEPDASVATDVYALGCVLFEALTGRTPFHGPSAAALIYQHLHAPPPAPSTLVDLPGSVDNSFDDVVSTALAKTPRERYRSAGALAHAAAGALGANHPGSTPQAPRRGTRLLTRAWRPSHTPPNSPASTAPLAPRRWQPQSPEGDRGRPADTGGSRSSVRCAVALGLNVLLGLVPAFGLGPVVDLCRVGRQCDQIWIGATVLAATVLGALFALLGLVLRRRRAACTRLGVALFATASTILLVAIIFDH